MNKPILLTMCLEILELGRIDEAKEQCMIADLDELEAVYDILYNKKNKSDNEQILLNIVTKILNE